MNQPALRLAWWRFRATFGRRWGSYLSIVLLVGLLGGLAMGSVAGARRTQSSYPVYLASTNPSSIQVFTQFAPITNTGYSAHIESEIAHLPEVTHTADLIGFDGNLAYANLRATNKVPGESPPAIEGSLNGLYVTMDRMTILEGRMFNPKSRDEAVISKGAAAAYGLHLGATVAMGFYTDAEEDSSTFPGYPQVKPTVSVTLKVVGIAENSEQIVQDDDAALGSQFALITPTLTRQLATCCAYYAIDALKISGGAQGIAAAEVQYNKFKKNLGPVAGARTYGPYIAKAEGSIRPESITFGVFGLVVALAALLIGGQVIGRLVRRNTADGQVLRALGAGPFMTMADGLIGIVGAVIAGSLLAVAIAIGLSPLAPLGAVRSVYPDRGIAFDWTVLGFGFALLVVVLSVAGLLMALRVSPHRSASPARQRAEHQSSVARVVASSGLPPSAVTGIRAALGAGSRSDAAPVRSAAFGTVLAVMVVVTAVTFGSSLNFLVSHPPTYGWNWNYALLGGFSAAADLPAAHTDALLKHDPDVEHWSGVYFQDAVIDGQDVPVLATTPNAAVSPTLLSGQELQAKDEVVLGPVTLAELHKSVGSIVRVNTGGGKPTIKLRVVGTATMPTIGSSGNSKLQMGTGAVMSSSLFSAGDLNQQESPTPGPEAYFITTRPGVSPSAARQSLDRINQALNDIPNSAGAGGVVSDLRPAEIADYHTIGSTPTLLAGILAAGAIGGLGLTLVASVRRRRRELALLKTLGFTKRQLAATLVWQSSVSAAIGVIIGMPLGIALGRWLWTLFARGISATPVPTVPALTMVLIAAGAVLFAVAISAVPGRIAARTPTALMLRAE